MTNVASAVAEGVDRHAQTVRRVARRRRRIVWAVRVGIVVVALAIWQWGLPNMLSPLSMRPASEVAQSLWGYILDGTAFRRMFTTLYTFVAGLIVGGSAAVLVGLAWHKAPPWVSEILEPYVVAIHAMPRLVFIPVLTIALGRGIVTVLVFVSFSAFVYTFFAVRAGLKETDGSMEMAIKLMGGSELTVTRYVLLPRLRGAIVTGLIVSAPFVLTSTLVAEMLAGADGLGNLVVRTRAEFNVSGLFAATVMAAAMGILIEGLVRRILRSKGE